MTLNLTLVGQALTFAFFIWFTLHYIWPPLMDAIRKREQTISEGLAAGEAGMRQLLDAQSQSETLMREARARADEVVYAARIQAQGMVDEAKREALRQSQMRLKMTDAQINQKWDALKAQLAHELGTLVVTGMEKALAAKGASNDAQRQWLKQVINTLT
jgi:F-type H+-transporting ATPase subunit b